MQKKPKEASAWRHPSFASLLWILKIAGAVALVLVLVAIAWHAWWTYRPDLLVNPIDRFIHVRYLAERSAHPSRMTPGGFSVSMLPEVFAERELATNVIRRVVEAGFHWIGSQNGKEVYRKAGAAPTLLCQTDYYVTISVDTAGKVTDVKASTGSFCV